MHFVLSCYLQCTLWGGETQQALSQEGDCCPWAKQPHPSPRLGKGSGADPRLKAPCQGQLEALGKHPRWAEGWRCAEAGHPQPKAHPASLPLARASCSCFEAHCQLL